METHQHCPCGVKEHKARGLCNSCYKKFLRARNPELAKEKDRESYRRRFSADPERVRENQRKLRERNPARAAAYMRRYRDEDPARFKKYSKDWASRNAETIREKSRRYNAENLTSAQRKAGWTRERFDALWQEQNACCATCSVAMVRGLRGTNSVRMDHDHSTSTPRGLLCHVCNVTLGMYEKHLRAKGLMYPVFEQYLSKFEK